MARKQTKAQKETVERVMHEFKHGELKTAGSKRKVKNPKQAIAIALHEAGASKYESPKENKRQLRKTKEKERRGETSMDEAEGRGASRKITQVGGRRRKSARASTSRSASRARTPTKGELYAEAKRRDIPGRSRMSKAQLQRALKK